MKFWKVALGLGVACAACCAVPLLSGTAALVIGSASLATAGSALLACTGELGMLVWVLPALAAVALGVAQWRRARQRRTYCVPGECR